MVSIFRPQQQHVGNHAPIIENCRHRQIEIVTIILLILMLAVLVILQKSTVDDEALMMVKSLADNSVTIEIEDNDDVVSSSSTEPQEEDSVVENQLVPPQQRKGWKEPEKELHQNKQWEFQLLDNGDRVDCKIYTNPIASNESAIPPSIKEYFTDTKKERYVIHIHGLHHTGTGYLRQTLHDELNRAFSKNDNDVVNPSPVASIQDSMRPYQHLLDEAGKNRTKIMELYKQYHKSEDEGHHLQFVYPRFYDRVKELQRTKTPLRNAYKMTILADLCTSTDNANPDASHPTNSDDLNKKIGDELMRQWSRFWDTSATFLLQKTPTLDVGFLERTKVLPTLHLMIVRHPMTSNSWGTPQMGEMWANAWAHTFELLATDEIEWYAVVAYEALILDHDKVVEELLEVVRSGMQTIGRNLRRTASSNGNTESKTVDTDMKVTGPSTQQLHRRLEYRNNPKKIPKSPSAYLIPKKRSVDLWRKCIERLACSTTMNRLTKDVLPYFGYQSNGRTLPFLSASPSIVKVNREFGRILFSSEGVALNKFRQSRGSLSTIEYKPPLELIRKMRAIMPRQQPQNTP